MAVKSAMVVSPLVLRGDLQDWLTVVMKVAEVLAVAAWAVVDRVVLAVLLAERVAAVLGLIAALVQGVWALMVQFYSIPL